METKIHTLKFYINRCYIIRQKSTIMIDGGPPGKVKNFEKYLTKHSINPKEINLIVITHGDFDHIGSAKEIKELTNAKIAIHEKDKINLEEGKFHWPPAANTKGQIIRSLSLPFFKIIRFPAVNADITLTDNEFPLYNFGIDGRIIHTPGHTAGSITVLLDSGEAFVGCLAHANKLFRLKPNLPIFAENIEQIKESWKIIIEKGARIIYPGHGNPFHIDEIKKYLN